MDYKSITPKEAVDEIKLIQADRQLTDGELTVIVGRLLTYERKRTANRLRSLFKKSAKTMYDEQGRIALVLVNNPRVRDRLESLLSGGFE